MQPTTETSDELTYDMEDAHYVITKTDPPSLTVTYPNLVGKTWQDIKASFDLVETPS